MTPDEIRRWSEEVAREPGSLAFLRLADALRRDGRLVDARAVALRGLERHPYLADAHDMLARVYAAAGDAGSARDEWQMALSIEPGHGASLKGLGFLAFRSRDLAGADRYLRQARALNPSDEGLALAHRRVLDALTQEEAPQSARTETADPPKSEAPSPPARVDVGMNARELFASLLGTEDRTALLLDRDGLVLAGAYVDEHGRDVSDEVGAELSGVSDEASRALEQLGLGPWSALLAEAQHATVGLAPAGDGAIVLVAAARDTHVGFVRRLLMQARDRAASWLGAPP